MHLLRLVMAWVVLSTAPTLLDGKPRRSAAEGHSYELTKFIREDLNSDSKMTIVDRLNLSETMAAGCKTDFEWEGYDGWYNNPAHPEWGGAGE